MSAFKMYHSKSKVFVISLIDLPKQPVVDFNGEASQAERNNYLEALSTALRTKGIELINAVLMNGDIITETNVLVIDARENQLYDIPEGFEVKIEEQRYQIDDGPGEYEYIQVATIVPVALPEKTNTEKFEALVTGHSNWPEKAIKRAKPQTEESQDECWSEVISTVNMHGFIDLKKLISVLKSKFTIQRKP